MEGRREREREREQQREREREREQQREREGEKERESSWGEGAKKLKERKKLKGAEDTHRGRREEDACLKKNKDNGFSPHLLQWR